MLVIADITVPVEDFELGRLFRDISREFEQEIGVEVEQVVPLRDNIMPLFWVEGVENSEIPVVEDALRDDPLTKSVAVLTEADGRVLFELRWDPSVDRLVQPLVQTDARVLMANMVEDEWQFRLQFPDREALSRFRDRCAEREVNFELVRLYNPTSEEPELVTPEQQEALAAAHELGYWNIPREASLADVGEHLGISDSATSQRLRRGVDALVGEWLERLF